MRGSGYSALERCLHWLALEPAAVRRMSFDLERWFALPDRPGADSPRSRTMEDPADGAVYVCGLARSGTTILLRILDRVDDLRSLHYRDMPFVLAPNLWDRVTRHLRRNAPVVERAHGDGILVDYDSPEAFEEVFWRTFCPEASGPGRPSPEALAAFTDYRALVANPWTGPGEPVLLRRRYLSKNNNNLARLSSLCDDPSATVLLVYRNPLDTALSLHRQHRRFCAVQAQDRFTRLYMRWLDHREFGLDHRPFGFALPEMDAALSPDAPDYWLDYWRVVHSHVLAQKGLRMILVDHGGLCASPEAALEALFAALRVRADVSELARVIAPPPRNGAEAGVFRSDLRERAEATYRALRSSQKNLLVET